MGANKLYAEERLKKIIEYIENNNATDVKELAEYFGVSGATIRADFRELEMRNLISRTHGGAMPRENGIVNKSWFDPGYNSRINTNINLKEKIGLAVSGLIQDDETIMLDDGSTTLEVAKHLPKDKYLTVVTNGLNICMELRDSPNVKVINVGGIFNKVDLSFNGKIAEQTTKKLHAGKAILGASGVSYLRGITAPEEAKAELKKIMIENSAELIIVADHTKLEKISLLPVCDTKRVTTLVTDDMADPVFIENLRSIGVQVILAT